MAKILVVDDAIFMRKLLSDILIKAGHTVVGEAEDGEQAYKKYKSLKPDIVTMDITMPNCSGIEGVRLIKDEFPDAKVVMCSAMGQMNMVVESIKAGAMDFIIKPFQAEDIINKIEILINK